MSTADFFDVNAVGSDSHLQFMNWTVNNNGAFDYAADTRGYTYGLLAEYYDRFGAFRLGEMLMPTVANGIDLDWNITRASGENFELELHRTIIPDRESVLRLLAFVNHADMGNYRETINGYLSGHDPVPDVVKYRKQGRVKYGFGINLEQPITGQVRAFARLGWNEGANESFAYTEVDRTVQIGGDLRGQAWRRPNDKIGAAFVTNGISGDHRRYCNSGGSDFF
ncbi:MAG: carbohydrate porin [Acidobacteriaceae bacterium]|nr:carbohydrate porin [Acidobacteriaceae bacterium]